jgi:hypothetical protein
MKALNRTITKSLLGLFLASTTVAAFAQTAETSAPSKLSFNVSADLVSSYVWRGFTQGTTHGGTPNIQPTASVTYAGFTLGAWGSGSFDGAIKEIDTYASYAFNDMFSLTVTDYNWGFTRSYFDYNKNETDHILEGTLAFAGTKSFPLSVSVNTMFSGADRKYNSDSTKYQNAFSTYIELAYPIAKNAKLTVGGLYLAEDGVLNGYAFDKKGFNISNVAIKVSKDLKFTDSFSLPVYGIIGFNPAKEDAYLVGGITF